jgi:kynurenine formamidase
MTALPRYHQLPASADQPARSSWGLWGSQDQLGCLNKVPADAVRSAAHGVRAGQVFSLNASLELFESPLFDRAPTEHQVVELDRGLVRDESLSSFNTQCSTHWDGFRHAQHRVHGFYNGLAEQDVAISAWAERGIAGRGTLLDVEAARASDGRPLRQHESDPITVDDLELAARHQGVTIEPGDFLVVHTGWLDWARENISGGMPEDFRTPGLRPCARTVAQLWDWHIAAVASDTPAVEVWPPGAFTTSEERREARTDPSKLVDVFMHADLIALLGLPLGELWDTGSLATACREQGRWEFLLTSAPLNIPHGVASPGNVIAIL